MSIEPILRAASAALVCIALSAITGVACADDAPVPAPPASEAPESLLHSAHSAIQATVGEALALMGVPYKRGGSSPEIGFDCSGFVSHVYQHSIGLILPHSARAMSKEGEKVNKQALQPGDLVFFHTMRRAFSHVGIYLGDGLFVHAPRSGGKVCIEDMKESYWTKRYNGARRVVQ